MGELKAAIAEAEGTPSAQQRLATIDGGEPANGVQLLTDVTALQAGLNSPTAAWLLASN